MKKLMVAAAVAALLGAGAFANTYYVDANYGDDAWDGSTPEIPSQAIIDAGGTIPGPRKTLHAMMSDERVVVGDVVCAGEGDYNDGGVANGSAVTINRVQVKAGVTLKATGSRDATFITGSGGAYEVGAARCVFFLAPPSKAAYSCGIVKGFTLRNGRTANTSEHGGASTGSGLLVECDFQGNGCAHSARGGTMNGGTALRCRFSSDAQGYMGYSGAKAVDSLIASGSFYSGCVIYNCTFMGGGTTRNSSTYNCLFIGSGASDKNQSGGAGSVSAHYNAFSRYAFHATACTTNGTCRVVTAAETPYDEATYRPQLGSVAINAGDPAYYVAATNGWKSDWIAECGKDYCGGARLFCGRIDVGCAEYDPCVDFSALLSPDGAFTVTNVTSSVTGADDSVSIGANETLLGTLNLFDASTTMWSFFAEVKGTGTLKVYFADAAEPSQTVTATDEPVEVKYTADEATGLKLVYEGEDGVAEVSRFSNVTRVSIAAEGTEGLVISGDFTAAGEYVVAPGETKSVTFKRANAGLTYVSGITVNGTFYNLYDYPSDVTFTVNGSERATAIAVETVTAEPKELFVDRVNGSDSNCGLYTNLAFQSLARAASVATANWTILALPGIYDNEVSNPEKIGTATTLNRVTLPANVTLKAIGTAEETFIMGAKSDAPNADSYGCGTNAVRCVLMNSGSRTRGFTLTGGRTFTGVGGGGASSGTLVDCIVSNNVCSGKGGGASGTAAYRCRFYWNECGSGQTGPGMNTGSAYGCYFKNCNTYQTTTCQCTFDSGAWVRANPHYNDLYLYDGGKYINTPTFYHCYFTYTPNTHSSPVLDSECVITNAAALPVDARGCPTDGSLAIDAGRTDYLETIPEAYRDIDAFGGQRVYNGAVDVGCGEYDWRGDFAKTLAKKDVTVDVATANVTTNLEAGVDVPAGESLKLKLVLRTDGKVSFKAVADDGAVLAVTVGDEPVTPGEGGLVEFEGVAGETEVEIAVTGEGKAAVSDVILPKLGALLLVR